MTTSPPSHDIDPVPAHSYILVSGSGRSGSNRVLDIFDQSSRTACRNEANEVPGGEFHAIGGLFFEDNLTESDYSALTAALRRAGLRRSSRDRLDQYRKDYLNPISRPFLRAMSKTRLRRVFVTLGVMANENEWALPASVLNRDRLDDIRPVIKLLGCQTWAEVLINRDKNCQIVHNLRGPLPFLQSWFNRFILKSESQYASFTQHFDDVPRILRFFGRDDAERLREPRVENLIEVEIWRWRYINERLLALSSHPGQYMLVTYNEVDRDPVSVAERLYDFAGLPMDEEAAVGIQNMRNTLFAKPHETNLDTDVSVRLIDEVLKDSPLGEFGHG